MIKTKHKKAGGAALLVVLFIIMAITVLAFGFLSRSDIELACGQNMTLRTATDYLAESGLQHARGLILNPQDVSAEYWPGATGQQLDAGNDYYDVNVVQLSQCDYRIISTAYRKKDGQETGRSSLEADLRLDPCIAMWVGTLWFLPARVTVNGDVYCKGALVALGAVTGDAFAAGNITSSSIAGTKNSHVSQPPVAPPGLTTSDFSSSYYIGTSNYSVEVVAGPNFPAGSYFSSIGNPAGVYYCNGDVNLPGNVNINGMLVVNGNLKVKGTNNVITAVKNFPALVVGGEMIMENGATLEVNGLAQVRQRIYLRSGALNVHITVNGALFILNGCIDNLVFSTGSTVNVTAVPDKAAIQVWLSPGTPTRWSPAAGAFFRSIRRQ